MTRFSSLQDSSGAGTIWLSPHEWTVSLKSSGLVILTFEHMEW